MTRYLKILTIGATAYAAWAVTAPLLAFPHTTADVIATQQPMLLLDELLMQTDWIGPAATRRAWTGISLVCWCVAALAAQRWGALLVPPSGRAQPTVDVDVDGGQSRAGDGAGGSDR
jgi:hypothetical protein